MMTSDTLPNFCAAYCACGKLAAARSGEHGAARKQQRRRQQQALALCARRRPQPALDLVGGAAFLQGAPVDEARLARIVGHLGGVGHGSHRDRLLVVERPLAQPAAAEAHACTVVMQQLIALPSVNPDQMLLAGHDLKEVAHIVGESRVCSYMAERIVGCGGEAIIQETGEKWVHGPMAEVPRPNVIGVWRSEQPGAPWYAIDTHTDTVMVVGMEPFEPFSGTLTRDGKIHGRGSCDTKAAFACLVVLLEEARARAEAAGTTLARMLKANLVICGTSGEETGRLGCFAFRDWLHERGICCDEMLVTEPTLCTPVFAHKGTVRLTFHIHGVAAHSSKPHLGMNALVVRAIFHDKNRGSD
jgi:acetylornithine deacetylase/succinyl-diaminopimelate desuccinylase-like protein